MRLLIAILGAASPLSAQLTITPAAPVRPTDAVQTGARFLRWTILERRGAENSVQASDLAIIGAFGAVQPWSTKAVVTNPDGAGWPANEGPEKLIDLTPGWNTKWLSMGFASSFSATRGRQTIIVDNVDPLPPILGYVWFTGDDRPERDPVTWTVDLSADGQTWVRVDSVRLVPPLSRREGVTRRLVETLRPIAVAPARTCDAHPAGFAVRTGGTSYTGLRTERTTVERGGVCLGVVTLRTATSYMIHIRTAGGWRSPTTAYTSRASAEAAIIAAGGK